MKVKGRRVWANECFRIRDGSLHEADIYPYGTLACERSRESLEGASGEEEASGRCVAAQPGILKKGWGRICFTAALHVSRRSVGQWKRSLHKALEKILEI